MYVRHGGKSVEGLPIRGAVQWSRDTAVARRLLQLLRAASLRRSQSCTIRRARPVYYV